MTIAVGRGSELQHTALLNQRGWAVGHQAAAGVGPHCPLAVTRGLALNTADARAATPLMCLELGGILQGKI